MKIIKISSILLKYMVEDFHNTGNDTFIFSVLSEKFFNFKEYEIINALYLLSDDNLISISSYDNQPSIIFLSVKSISKIEQETLIKKGYDFIKEIKSIL